MREMKESGIDWISSIPENWKKVYLKTYYDFEKGKNAALYTKEYIGKNNGEYPVYSGQTENNGIMGEINTFDYNLEECLFTTTVGAKVMTPRILKGKFSLSQNCLIMKRKKDINNKYIFYTLLTMFDYEKSMIPSYMQPSLRVEDLKKYYFYIPDLIEQEKIANFLDEKITEIDSVIQKTKETIEDYKKYKQAVISKLILNNNYPKKIIKLKNVAKRITDGAHISPETENGVYDFISTVNLDNDIIDFNNCLKTSKNSYETMVRTGCKPDKGDILISKDGTVGKSVVVNEGYEFVVASSLVIVKLREDMAESEYINYVIKSDFVQEQLNSYMHGAGLKRVSVEKNANLKIVYIDKKYQKDIINHLEKVCKKIDSLINNKGKILKELEQYKSALIYEYVTGKKEVV